MATLVRHEKAVAQAWLYTDRSGDYLIFINENENYGPFLLTNGKNGVASCAVEPLVHVGGRYFLTPVYLAGAKMRCVGMDGAKTSENNFNSVPYDWPPAKVGNWSIRW